MAENGLENVLRDERGMRGPPQACVFVASIASTSTEEKLQEHFSKFGQVLKVKLMKDKAMRPYAFVQFLDSNSADTALQAEELHQVDGRRLRVERAKVNRTLFVAKFSLALLPAELRRMAEIFGEVESVTIIKHHVTNKSKGCGFLKYKYREDAADAFTGLKTKNKKWVVEWATSANDPEVLGVAKNLVYVGGLPFDRVTESNLRSHFSVYGSIEEVSIIHPSVHLLRRESALSGTTQQHASGAISPPVAAPEASSTTHRSADLEQAALAAAPTATGLNMPAGEVRAASPAASLASQAPVAPNSGSPTLANQETLAPTPSAHSEQQSLKTTAPRTSAETPTSGDAPIASRGDSFSSGSPASPPPAAVAADMTAGQIPSAQSTLSSSNASRPARASDPALPKADAEDTASTAPIADASLSSDATLDERSSTARTAPPSDANAAGEAPLLNGKPITSYAFITFSDPHAAASAIENEDGSTFLGIGPIRVQYCETPDMKLRKKLSKMRDVYPAPGPAMVLTDPNAAASYTAALYGQHAAHAHHAGALPAHAGPLVAAPPGSFVPHPHHVAHPSQHRAHPHPPQYGYFQGAAPGYPHGASASGVGSAGSPSGAIGSLGVASLGTNGPASATQGYGWAGSVGTSPNDPSAWYYVGPPAPLSINVPPKDLMLDLSTLSLDPTSPVAVPLGFPFSPSPTFAPLAFPPIGQLSPLTAPGMPYFPMASYGLNSSSGSSGSASSPSAPHVNSNTSYGSYGAHSGGNHSSTSITPKSSITPLATNTAALPAKVATSSTTAKLNDNRASATNKV